VSSCGLGCCSCLNRDAQREHAGSAIAAVRWCLSAGWVAVASSIAKLSTSTLVHAIDDNMKYKKDRNTFRTPSHEVWMGRFSPGRKTEDSPSSSAEKVGWWGVWGETDEHHGCSKTPSQATDKAPKDRGEVAVM